MAKAIVPRECARRGIDGIVDYYRREAGPKVAVGFIDDLQAAVVLIGSYPACGSLRYAYELGLPGLRSFRLDRYPYLIFYRERAEHVDVWRVLHAGRDIPAWLDETGGPEAIETEAS